MSRSADPTAAALRAAAAQALDAGDLAGCERHANAALARTPDDGECWLLAGVAAAGLGRVREALPCLANAVRLLPDQAAPRAQLARLLSLTGQLAEAERIADEVLACANPDALSLDTVGVVYSRSHAHAKACAAFRTAIARAPQQPAYQFNLATSLKFLGDFDAAERAYEACLAADPEFWKAHSGLAQLRRQTAEANHLARLESLQPRAQSRLARVHLNQALFKEWEDVGEHGRAFAHLQAAKQARREGHAHSAEADAQLFDAIERLFPAPLAMPADAGCDSREPIFVIGMPRSGTTLVERILSSHPDVYSAGELQNFARVVKQLAGTRTREIADAETLARALAVDARQLGETYLHSTRPATAQRPRFVDKMPMNFLYAGHIARALPQARIVCLRRHPLDTILSNYRQLFSLDNRYYHYADDLLDCTRYFIRFDRLLRHWQQVLPGRILEIGYETLIEAQDAQTHRLLDHCGLDWHPACLAFEQNAAPVSTASAVQVREPIHRGAMQRWKRHAEALAPAIALLREAGIACD